MRTLLCTLLLLGACAAQTRRITLATGVTTVFARSPATIAIGAITVDNLSGGRFELGLGVGHPEIHARRDDLEPRRDVDACKTCSRPFLYEPSEWPAALLTPLQELNKWHMAHRDAPTVAFHDVPDPAGVAHRIDAELRHVADVTKQRVRVRRSFRTKQLAKQNAALCALHQMHLID